MIRDRQYIFKGIRDLRSDEIVPGFLERITQRVRASEGCTLWTGARNSAGYGVARIEPRSLGGRIVLVHRLVYALAWGIAPSDLVIDHLCRVRLCVHPDHLRAILPELNTPWINGYA